MVDPSRRSSLVPPLSILEFFPLRLPLVTVHVQHLQARFGNLHRHRFEARSAPVPIGCERAVRRDELEGRQPVWTLRLRWQMDSTFLRTPRQCSGEFISRYRILMSKTVRLRCGRVRVSLSSNWLNRRREGRMSSGFRLEGGFDVQRGEC